MNPLEGNETGKQLDGLYARLRGQLEHETQLYNQRIVWLITIQAFLFATVGLVVQAMTQSTAGTWMARLEGLLLTVCGLGAVVALISNQALGNASAAIDKLSRHWNTRSAEFSPDLLRYYPHPHGNDGQKSKSIMLSSRHIPKYFLIAWLAVALVFFGYQLTEAGKAMTHLISEMSVLVRR